MKFPSICSTILFSGGSSAIRLPHPNVPKEHKEQSLGSGVIVSEDGYIVTNNHVIEKAQEIKVLLSNKRDYKAKLIGADPKTDIAVIKIDAKGLTALPWGDSNKLKVGEIVFAIGNPFGLNQTVTMGVIGAVGRANVGIADYEDFIQTDAAINPGNSGGALINARGELIGINTAILSRTGGYQGIGFAVPSSMARQVMDSLVKYKKVVRGWLGVSIQEVTSDLAEEFGVKDLKGALVSGVMKGSPAEKAGIKQGDVILQYNGKTVEDTGSPPEHGVPDADRYESQGQGSAAEEGDRDRGRDRGTAEENRRSAITRQRGSARAGRGERSADRAGRAGTHAGYRPAAWASTNRKRALSP